jgi:hypothetical protein
MEERELDGKKYLVYIKKGKHLVQSNQTEGAMSALQFDNKDNSMCGPVELIEVDEASLQAIDKQEFSPNVQFVLDEVATPIVQGFFDIGVDRILHWLEEKAIPAAKRKTKELTKNSKINVNTLYDAITGKELIVYQLLRDRELEMTKNTDASFDQFVYVQSGKGNEKNTNQQKETRSFYEVQQILETMRNSAVAIATCIRILSNTVVRDNEENPKTILEMKKELERLSNEAMMNQIDLLLEDKNRSLLDDSSYLILLAFRQGDFIVEGKLVPIKNYLIKIKE